MSADCVPSSSCRHFRGEIPCIKKKVCWNCDEYEPVPRRALVIKFGAAGDALRTTPILARLRQEGYGEITWICDEASADILSLARNIDRLLVFSPETLALLAVEEFDTVYSFDKAPAAAALAATAKSSDKRGFTLTPQGRLSIFDERSAYALRLGMDDELKFRGNRKTVPQILFEMAGYDYDGEEYELEVTPVAEHIIPGERQGRVVALNIGVGFRWPSKAWPDDCWIRLARLLMSHDYHPVFVGGEAERDMLADYAARAGTAFLPPSSVRVFAETIASVSAVVSADSLGMHVALAVGTTVLGLFCSTSADEIEWFGRGEAIVAGHGPCYTPGCGQWPSCMRSIQPETVMERLTARLGND